MISDINFYSRNNNNVKISEGVYIYFSYLVTFLNDIKNGNINNLNIKKAYENKITNIEIELASTKRESNDINKYRKFVNILRNIVDKSEQKNNTSKD